MKDGAEYINRLYSEADPVKVVLELLEERNQINQELESMNLENTDLYRKLDVMRRSYVPVAGTLWLALMTFMLGVFFGWLWS